MPIELLPQFLKDIQEELDDCAQLAPLVPSSLRRFFLLLIRGHWASAANFGPELEDSLACLTWNPDPNARQIDIELSGTTATGGRQHTIWVAIGNFKFRQLSFGKRSDDFEEDNATERYVVACSCQLLVRHDAPALDTAFDMAWTTFCFLLGFNDAIVQGLGEGASFTPEVLGEPKLEEQSPKSRFRVDVGARLDINLAVATTVESHRLKLVSTDQTALS